MTFPIQKAGRLTLREDGEVTYILKTDGSLWAIGANDGNGSYKRRCGLGDGTDEDRLSPVLITDGMATDICGE